MLTHGNELYGQFALAMGAFTSPAGWQTRTLRRWTLAFHPLLPVLSIEDQNAVTIGWLIGHAISDTQILRDRWTLSIPLSDDRGVEDELYRLGGRWVCVLIADGFSRVYLDPSGSLAAVYRTDRRLLGSTPTVVHLDELNTYRSRKERQPVLQANQFWPGELTSDDDTRRLLPNHYLDMESWQPHRHWPLEPIEPASDAQVRDHVQRVIHQAGGMLRTIAQEHELYMGLTAGRDSRMILGCARPVIDRITFVTYRYKNKSKFADLHIARALARKLNLQHQALELNDPPESQKREYLYRVGYCANPGKACDFYEALGALQQNRIFLTGYGGEVGRAFYWGQSRLTSNPCGADLLARMNLPIHELNLNAVRQWLAGLPGWVDPYTLLDLMYLELRLGCWASPQQYGTAPFQAILAPLSHREIYRAILSLPVEYRRQQRLAQDVIELTWPEALELPFQQFSGWRGTAQRWIDSLQRMKPAVEDWVRRSSSPPQE